METKYKVITVVVVIATAFAAGRYSVPVQVKDEKTKVDTSVVQKDKNTVTHVVTVIKPNGEKVITRDTREKTETDKKNDIAESEIKTVTKESRHFAIFALAGIDISNPGKGFSPGINLQTTLVGPTLVDGQCFLNGNCAVGLGLQF